MKKISLFAAVAVIALASCSSDDTLSVNQGEAISFRTSVNGLTRAADITLADLNSFVVTAKKVSNGQSYFDNVTFSSIGTSYVSSNKYYWPSDDALDFFAFAPAANAQVVYGDYKTFTVTPSANLADQVDLVYAATKGKDKNSGLSGVPLNFRHTGAKVRVQVKNTASNLKFDVEGWKVGYLSPSGTFTFTDPNTDGQGAATLSYAQWGNWTAASADVKYESLFAKKDIAASTDAAQLLNGEMILVPQTQAKATKYESNNTEAKVQGSYVAVKLVIRNNDAEGTVIASDGTGNAIWAIWPVDINWEPGKRYTYTIDLAGGGYYEENPNDPDDGTDNLDPILGEIKFVTVTVDDWVVGGDFDVNM